MDEAVERYRLIQHGMPVAEAEGPNALSEILHYAFVYRQDAPAMIEQHRNGKWRKWPLRSHAQHLVGKVGN